MLLLSRSKRLRQIGGVAETANLLGLRLLLRNPTAYRMYPGIMLRSYAALGGKCAWRSRTIAEVCPEAVGQRIQLEHLSEPSTALATSISELAYLGLLARGIAPRVVFEIGTYRGRTALTFALNTPDDCKIYTLDLPPGSDTGHLGSADAGLVSTARPDAAYFGKAGAEKIEQIYADSTRFDFAPFEKQVDLFFVDGAHHYDAVVSDTRNALRAVRSGGLIVWHDFANYGDFADVTRAVLDILPHDRVFQLEDTQLAVYRAD